MNYVARVTGDYFVVGANGNILRPFDVELVLITWEKAQNFARSHLLPRLLKQADPDFNAVRKCIIEHIVTEDGNEVPALPMEFMSRPQLEGYIKTHNLGVIADMYPDIHQLRKQISFAQRKPEIFAREEAKKKGVYDKLGATLALNKQSFTMAGEDRKAKETPQNRTTVKKSRAKNKPAKPAAEPVTEVMDVDGF